MKAVVEKVSLTLAITQGLVGPKLLANTHLKWRKGIRLIFLNFSLWCSQGGNAFLTWICVGKGTEEFSFLCNNLQ